jgi:hypothetical protein
LLGVGIGGLFELVKDLYKNDLISLSQIAFNLLEK